LIVFDSSACLEFFGDGHYNEEFATRLRHPIAIVTPTIALYEVYKWIKRERSEHEAMRAAATMKKTQVVELSDQIALTAADLSLSHKLAMADSIILATARAYDAELLTLDSDFAGIEGVRVFSRKQVGA
jgi:predicted nucleic acid-binding protein